MNELEVIEGIADRILQENPDPVVCFRLLRDVLKDKAGSGLLVRARARMLKCRRILELANEQREDGSWGRFHSAMKCKGKIVTTEAAVERALALGLDASDTVFQATIGYLTLILEGKTAFPDPPERNNRWATGTQLFAAATLARICPSLAVLDKPWKLWVEIAERTFVSGGYDEDAEIRAHEALTGASVKNSYLILNNRYQLELLGARGNRLPKAVETALFDWVWHRSDGVGYLEIPLVNPPKKFTAGMRDRFFTSLEILSCFPSWKSQGRSIVDWFWEKRNSGGLWDFGPRASTTVYFPLSENWREAKRRQHDWITRTLTLIRRFHD